MKASFYTQYCFVMIVHFLKSSVVMNLSHLEAKAAVLADSGLIRDSV
jgi:hypothetical protein